MSPLPDAAQTALEQFNQAAGWEQRARLLLEWGQRLAPLSDAERCTANQVQGCSSQVWLVADGPAGARQWRADSDARLLRGLLAVLLVRVNTLPASELAQLDIADWFNQLGLQRQLTPSRSNGLYAVLQHIREHA